MLSCDKIVALSILKVNAGDRGDDHMKHWQNRMHTARRKWAAAFPVIFVSLFMFFSIFLLFGIGQVIMVSFLTLLFRTKSQKDFSLQDLLHCYGIMLIVCGASYAASLNLILCFFLNLLVPFFLVFLLTDKFNPKAYLSLIHI